MKWICKFFYKSTSFLRNDCPIQLKTVVLENNTKLLLGKTAFPLISQPLFLLDSLFIHYNSADVGACHEDV